MTQPQPQSQPIRFFYVLTIQFPAPRGGGFGNFTTRGTFDWHQDRKAATRKELFTWVWDHVIVPKGLDGANVLFWTCEPDEYVA